MNYHGYEKDDIRNGNGIRVSIWVSGCEFNCDGCFNQQTHPFNSGIPFDKDAKEKIFEELDHDYVSGLSILGGEPLHPKNRNVVTRLCKEVKERFPKKDIWVWTGYLFDVVRSYEVMKYIDVLCDGRFVKALLSPNKPYVGSENQRVIDVRKTLEIGSVVLWEDDYKTDGARYIGKCGCGE